MKKLTFLMGLAVVQSSCNSESGIDCIPGDVKNAGDPFFRCRR